MCIFWGVLLMNIFFKERTNCLSFSAGYENDKKKRFNLLYLNIWKYRKQYNSVQCLWHLLQKLYGCLDWSIYVKCLCLHWLQVCNKNVDIQFSVHFSKIIFISYAQNQKYWKAKQFKIVWMQESQRTLSG